MNDLRKAAQQALEALEMEATSPPIPETAAAINALRAALAHPEPLEPAGEEDMKVYAAIAEGYGRLEKRIGCVQHDCDVCQARVLAQPEPVMVNGLTEAETNASASVMGLTRPQRKPLTEEEIYKLFGWYAVPFVRAVERAHGIGEQND